jgi:uncharacterized membrane protein
MEKLKLTTKPKRNYQFVQILLDFFALAQLYLIVACIVDVFEQLQYFNKMAQTINEQFNINPLPIIVWGVLAGLVFTATIITPLIYKNKTKLNQKQFDIWVYAVYLIRVLLLLIIFYLLDTHFNILIKEATNIFSVQILLSVVLIVIIIRFTQIRIRAAQPKTEEKTREIVED